MVNIISYAVVAVLGILLVCTVLQCINLRKKVSYLKKDVNLFKSYYDNVVKLSASVEDSKKSHQAKATVLAKQLEGYMIEEDGKVTAYVVDPRDCVDLARLHYLS